MRVSRSGLTCNPSMSTSSAVFTMMERFAWGTAGTAQVPASILRFRHRAKRGSSSAEHCFDRQPLPMGPIPLGMTNEHQCLRMHVAREFKCPAYDLWAVHGSSHPTAAETSSPGGKEQGLERTAH